MGIYKDINIYIIQNNEDDFYTHYNNIWHFNKNYDKLLVHLYKEGHHFDYLNFNDENNNNECIIKINS